MNERKVLLLLLVLALLPLGVFAGGKAEPQVTGTYEWKFAHEEPPGVYQDEYAKEFARRMAEKSGGKITINVFPLGTLGGDLDVFEACTEGAIEFVISSPGVAATIVPEAQFLLLHFLFSDNMEVNKKVISNKNSVAFKGITDAYAKKNVKTLGYWSEGYFSWTCNRPITKLADFQGVKFRTMRSPLIVDSYRAYGANPTPMPFAEVYSGLQLKMIDGQENPDYYIYANKLFQVQDYVIIAKHALFMNATIVNQKFFDSLPKDVQKMIVDTVDGMYTWAEDWGAKFNAEAVDKMVKERPELKVIRLTAEQRKPFAQAAASVRQDYINLMEDKALAKKLLDAIVKEIADAEKSAK
jgi:tripartite ATP-independent transporter DctP family solute receptor